MELKTDQVLQVQFAKVGQLMFEIDILKQQLTTMENENKQLREQLDETRNIPGKARDADSDKRRRKLSSDKPSD